MKVCTFDLCDRRIHCKKLCEPHYRQFLFGKQLKELNPQRSKGATLFRDQLNRKECIGCHRWLNEIYFSIDRTTSDGFKVRCKLCKLLLLNNISFEKYQHVLNFQNGRCGVCKIDSENNLSIDHNHKCCPGRYSCGKCFRGLLCSNCNFAEGLLKSDVVIINNLLQYVKEGDIN